MPKKRKAGGSLYILLAIIIVVSVVTVLGAHGAHSYLAQRRQMVEEMKQSSALSMATLRKNIASYIEAYAVNEYANLVATEVELRNHFAIVISDQNMGKVLSREAYVSGKIRDSAGTIIDFDPEDPHHRRWLDSCFYADTAPILAASGAPLGTIAIYISDEKMKAELLRILTRNLIDTVSIALLLITLLFLFIHRLLFRPLSQIAAVIAERDGDGIPTAPIPSFAYREIALLTDTMNGMVEVIKRSRESLQAEHEGLLRSLRLNRLILETIPDLLWLKGIDGTYLMCNPQFERYFGARESEIIGRSDYDFVDRAMADAFREQDRAAMAVGEARRSEEWITLAGDGRRVLLETTKVPLVYHDGRVAGVLGIGHDITERHDVLQHLLERNARDAALNQSLPVGVLVYDNDLRHVVFANESAGRILEMAPARLIGNDLSDVSWRAVRENDESAQPQHPTWIQLRPGEAQQHVVLGLAFGERMKWISLNTEPFHVDGVLAGAIVSFMDISRERAMINELEMERRRFQLAIEGSQDGLWDWDPRTDKVFYSSRWKAMLGYGDAEIGDSIEEWRSRVHPDDLEAAMAAVAAHLRGETPVYENRHRLRCKDGSWKWILDRGKALLDADGKAIRIVGFHTDITEEMRHQEELLHSAKHDALTRLPNRFLFNELIQNLMYRCKRTGRLLALLFIDLDGFKEINDSHGHQAGDAVLVAIAHRIQNMLRQEDVVARLGGDEFVVAVADLNQQEEVVGLLQRLLRELSLPIRYSDRQQTELKVTASIGVSFYPQASELGPEALLRQADQAMYEAKNGGRNQYRLFNPHTETAYRERQQLVQEFRRALEGDELLLHYQPQLDMARGRVVGFEALLRWQHPTAGLIYPDRFLPALQQEKAVMLALGQWVFEHAFAQLSAWIEAGFDFGLGINVSAHEFKEQQWYAQLERLLARYPKVRPEKVELEILETSALDDTQQAMQMIRDCQQLGLRVALDDFGTGYSTLSYLKDLPVDTLKIDKSFVIEMLHDSGSLSILEAATGLAEAFRCEVVAEGVESIEHGVMLLQLGCNLAQGFGIARPMPATEVPGWMARFQPQTRWLNTRRLHHKDRALLYASIDHRRWIETLDRHLHDPSIYPLPELDPAHCRFGSWLQQVAGTDYQSDELRELRELHARLHEVAGRLCAGELPEGREVVGELHTRILAQIGALARP